MRISATERSTAFHEAGHAVAHFALGLPIDWVTIDPDDESLGRIRGQALRFHSDLDEISLETPRDRERVEAKIISSLSGPEAEAKLRGRRNRVGASSDYQQVNEILVRVYGYERGSRVGDAHVRYLEELARDLVETLWYLVETVAAELLYRRTLSGVVVRRLIREAVRERAPTVLPRVPATIDSLNAHGWRNLTWQVGRAQASV